LLTDTLFEKSRPVEMPRLPFLWKARGKSKIYHRLSTITWKNPLREIFPQPLGKL
jgi:hypothetical protein